MFSKALVSSILMMLSFALCAGQYSQQDSLRGTITPERAWWDLTHYDLHVTVEPETKSIFGKNTISYTVLETNNRLQIDLQEPMEITKVMQDEKELSIERVGNAYFIQLEKPQRKSETETVSVYWKGTPKVAQRPPWDGGFTWTKDSNGKHFIATSNQGIGSSIWWPNKDHPYDEVDSLDMYITVPKGLLDISNGRLVGIEKSQKTSTFHWTVKNPINNYGVNLNIGDYVNFGEVYDGEKGDLSMDYWVLRENLKKAKEQFKQAPMMMKAFEHWFGPYPFYEDSFKLVEAPYLGMEHQSSVTYGNQYTNGYLGNDLSGSGWGLKFDFIIIHEAGHEWFANNITNKDVADMWLHEGFTAYSENLYLDYHYGKDAAATYVVGTRARIQNDKPIIGVYGVNQRGSSDMYYKGANILHTLRTLANDDALWRATLRGLNKEFYHQTVSTASVENYISKKLGKDLTVFFDQYLRTTKIPELEYRLENGVLNYRYTNVLEGFKLPIAVTIGTDVKLISPSETWQTLPLTDSNAQPEFDKNMYVIVKEIL